MTPAPCPYAARHGLSLDAKSKHRATIDPVRPAHAIELAYRRKILSLVDELHRSTVWFVSAAWRRNPPRLALDEVPARGLSAAVRRLANRWQRRFDQAAKDLARWFATSTAKRSDLALKRALSKGGLSVEFKLTPAMSDVLAATVAENVALIRSIPRRYFTQVEGYVARSVTTGRDLKQLSDDLQHEFGVTRRRAAFISLDQSNKATANLQRVRQIDLGITTAVWVHSGGGKEPRPSHVKAGRDKIQFDLREGWWDPDEKKFVLPGELPRCRCVARPVIIGFSGPLTDMAV